MSSTNINSLGSVVLASGLRFGQLSTVDLLSQGDIRFWAQSSCGQAVIQTLMRGQTPYVQGETVRERKSKQASTLGEYDSVQYAQGDARNVFARAVKAGKAWPVGRESKRVSQSVSDPVAQYVIGIALQASAKAVRVVSGGRLGRTRDGLKPGGTATVTTWGTRDDQGGVWHSREQWADGADWSGTGRQVNTSSAEEALGGAMAALCAEIVRLARCVPIDGTYGPISPWDSVRRLCEPDPNQATAVPIQWQRTARGVRMVYPDRNRRSYLWACAYKAAFRSLVANFGGITGRQIEARKCVLINPDFCAAGDKLRMTWGSIADEQEAERRLESEGYSLLTPLTEADLKERERANPDCVRGSVSRDIAELRASRFETLPSDNARDRFRQARRLAWERLGCLPRRSWAAKAGATYNQAIAQRAAVRKWRVISLLLRGESSVDALRRAGLSAAYAVNGRLSEMLSAVAAA